MAKRRFEMVEGSSSKFWEVWVEGSSMQTQYGRIGTAGQVTVKDAGSPDKAVAMMEKLIAEKTKKGYAEVGGSSEGAPAAKPAAAKAGGGGEYDAQISKIEAKASKAGVKLNDGAKKEAIDAAEKALGRTLPEEVRAFYLRHDGAEDEAAIEGRELLSLERIVGEWRIWRDLLEKGTFEGNDHSTPGKGVQKRWWIWEWVPITYDGAGNHHVLDLAPAKDGTYGQVMSFYHDEGTREVVGKGFLAWLEKAPWGEAEEDE